jgi:TRAP-type C4-dicarboxylate transport system permease small subunit
MRIIERVGGFLLVLSMLAMTVSVALGVIFRYGLNRPLLWSDEVASSSLAWMTFIGAAMLYSQRNGHLSLTFLTDRLSPKARRVVRMMADFVELILLAVMLIGGIVFMHYNGEAVTSALELPVYAVYSVVPVTAFFAIAFLIRRMRYGPPPESQEPTNHHGEPG